MTTPLKDEEIIVDIKLQEAWKAWVTLPEQHPDDTKDFLFHFHALQRILYMRQTRRDYPDFFQFIR